MNSGETPIGGPSPASDGATHSHMLVVAGILVVFGAIIGGFLLEGGKLPVLLQPAELVIIGGAALGTVLIANPPHLIKAILRGVADALRPSRYGSAFYLEHLRMLNDLFAHGRKNGVAKLESDIDDPAQSQVFQKYPMFLADTLALRFLCDTLRTSISGGVSAFDLDQVMELDLDAYAAESHEPVSALTTVADSLPGLGIVAAVLGVVITMGALGGPPEEIGHKVAAALVGTFLGILLCYGLVGPLAQNLARGTHERSQFLQVLRVGILAFVKGLAPILAVEFARRGIPPHVRPTFQEMEQAIKGVNTSTAQQAA